MGNRNKFNNGLCINSVILMLIEDKYSPVVWKSGCDA